MSTLGTYLLAYALIGGLTAAFYALAAGSKSNTLALAASLLIWPVVWWMAIRALVTNSA